MARPVPPPMGPGGYPAPGVHGLPAQQQQQSQQMQHNGSNPSLMHGHPGGPKPQSDMYASMPPQAGKLAPGQMPPQGQLQQSNTQVYGSWAGPVPTSYESGPKKEIKLCETNKEKLMYQTLADVFAILKAADHLERAWRKSSVSDENYTKEMWKLINQFKSIRDANKETLPDPLRFIEEYKMDIPSGMHRLLVVGLPATVEHGEGGTNTAASKEKEKTGRNIAQATASFITAMDAVKLNMVAVDQLLPLLTDLVENLHKVDRLGDVEGKDRLKTWLAKLNSMRAVDTLNSADVRQLSLDLENCYASFHRKLDEL